MRSNNLQGIAKLLLFKFCITNINEILMGVVMGYRGGKIYLKIYCKLVEIAEKGETINYGKIGEMMGFP